MGLILSTLYFFLPAYASNMAPVLLNKLNFAKVPVDFGKKLGKKRLFGDHKTWGGLFIAIVTGTLVFGLQKHYLESFEAFQAMAIVDYSKLGIVFGVLMASGAIMGDLMKSMIKRRFGHKEGKEWFPFDQIDYVIGALAFISFIYTPKVQIALVALIVAPLLHYTSNFISYQIGLKSVSW